MNGKTINEILAHTLNVDGPSLQMNEIEQIIELIEKEQDLNPFQKTLAVASTWVMRRVNPYCISILSLNVVYPHATQISRYSKSSRVEIPQNALLNESAFCYRDINNLFFTTHYLLKNPSNCSPRFRSLVSKELCNHAGIGLLKPPRGATSAQNDDCNSTLPSCPESCRMWLANLTLEDDGKKTVDRVEPPDDILKVIELLKKEKPKVGQIGALEYGSVYSLFPLSSNQRIGKGSELIGSSRNEDKAEIGTTTTTLSAPDEFDVAISLYQDITE